MNVREIERAIGNGQAVKAVSMSRQIECVRREVEFRERRYGEMVRSGRMAQRNADDELEAMKAVLATLREVAAQRGI